jgi:hypothetical protein
MRIRPGSFLPEAHFLWSSLSVTYCCTENHSKTQWLEVSFYCHPWVDRWFFTAEPYLSDLSWAHSHIPHSNWHSLSILQQARLGVSLKVESQDRQISEPEFLNSTLRSGSHHFLQSWLAKWFTCQSRFRSGEMDFTSLWEVLQRQFAKVIDKEREMIGSTFAIYSSHIFIFKVFLYIIDMIWYNNLCH